MKPTLYLETSIVSYLTAQPSRDLVTAARQQITREWWSSARWKFDIYVSEFVLGEAGAGDSGAAVRRMGVLEGIPEVELSEMTQRLAQEFLDAGALPPKATLDALHVAVAVSGGLDYLLTWNFKHLANAAVRRRLESICRMRGLEPCIICTPEELLEE